MSCSNVVVFFLTFTKEYLLNFLPLQMGEYELIIKWAVFIFHGMPNIYHVSDQMSLTDEIEVS